MGLPSRFFEKKFVKDEKGDDITPFDGTSQNFRFLKTPKIGTQYNIFLLMFIKKSRQQFMSTALLERLSIRVNILI